MFYLSVVEYIVANLQGLGKADRRRSLVESAFSSIKARFGTVVAAKTLLLQGL